VDLSSDPAAIEYEDTVTFTCEADFSALNPVAYFRYSVDGGSYTVSSAVVINTVSNTASYDIEIDEYGEWEVECRVCEDDTVTSSCTTWGQATGGGGIGGTTSNPAAGTLGGMCGGIAVIPCESGLICQDADPPMPDAPGICVEPTTKL
jgi:hypothetical protein